MERLVAVVDDDISVRESLDSLARSVGMEVRVFASAEEFLTAAHPRKADCLVLDVRLPGMSAVELHRHLLARNRKVPVIFYHGACLRRPCKARSSLGLDRCLPDQTIR